MSIVWQVAPVTADDLPAISAIENQSPSPWSPDQLEGELFCPQGLQLVCRQPATNIVVGFLMARIVSDEAEILKIATDRTHRCQGIAGRLLREFTRLMAEKGVRKCHLELRSANTPARHLYEKFAFKVTGLRKNYYNNPTDDAFCMARLLY